MRAVLGVRAPACSSVWLPSGTAGVLPRWRWACVSWVAVSLAYVQGTFATLTELVQRAVGHFIYAALLREPGRTSASVAGGLGNNCCPDTWGWLYGGCSIGLGLPLPNPNGPRFGSKLHMAFGPMHPLMGGWICSRCLLVTIKPAGRVVCGPVSGCDGMRLVRWASVPIG